jgi:hypothetical protein
VLFIVRSLLETTTASVSPTNGHVVHVSETEAEKQKRHDDELSSADNDNGDGDGEKMLRKSGVTHVLPMKRSMSTREELVMRRQSRQLALSRKAEREDEKRAARARAGESTGPALRLALTLQLQEIALILNYNQKYADSFFFLSLFLFI